MPDTMTRERPILFSSPMIRAILAGKKTATRRVVKPQPPFGCYYEINGAGSHALCLIPDAGRPGGYGFCPPTPTSTDHRLRCPYGSAGDVLWVRETFSDPYPLDVEYKNFTGFYRATDPGRKVKWRPSIFMPRWACRIRLRITDVRVEELTAITEADARAEGFADDEHGTALDAFARLWEVLNGKRPGCSWADSPWVWCISFERIEEQRP